MHKTVFCTVCVYIYAITTRLVMRHVLLIRLTCGAVFAYAMLQFFGYTWEPCPGQLTQNVSFNINVATSKSNQNIEKKTEYLGRRCSESELKVIADLKPHKNSNCPDNDKWLHVLRNNTAG